MERFITNVEAQEFLKDYTENSETILLEEGAERNELQKIAKANGMDIKNSRDLGIFKTIYAFSNEPNANGAILPKKELLRVLPQIIGKPVNINHDRSLVVGHYIDYRYIQKKDTVVAYGVYYKSYYEDLWKEANKLFKSKKLSSSFEIWSPNDKKRHLADGTYELRSMEIAGGALIYEDEDNQPAFKNAKMLMMAKEKATTNDMELVYASKYKEEELLHKSNEVTQVTVVPTSLKLKCSNCTEEFETAEAVNIKCPKCQALLNKEGVMQYPPQIKDFKIMCPGCKVNNWLILSKTEESAKLRCTSCTKEYNIAFKKTEIKGLANKVSFVYTGSTSCVQCHTRIPVESISHNGKRETKCPKCGLNFSFDTKHSDNVKRISKIEEIIKDKINKSSDKGGKPMDKKETVNKSSEQKEAKPVEPKKAEDKKVEPKKADDKKPEVKAEIKPEVPKVKETPKVVDKPVEPKKVEVKKVDAPKPEVKVEKIVEPKAKETKPAMTTTDNVAEEVKVDAQTKTLDKLEDDVEKAKKVKSLVDRYQTVLKKAIAKLRTMRTELNTAKASITEKDALMKAELNKANKQIETKVEFYKANAKKVIERRAIVGEGLTDEEIINDDKFERASLELENAKFKTENKVADEIVGSKRKDDGYYSKMKDKINEVAFGKKKKK